MLRTCRGARCRCCACPTACASCRCLRMPCCIRTGSLPFTTQQPHLAAVGGRGQAGRAAALIPACLRGSGAGARQGGVGGRALWALRPELLHGAWVGGGGGAWPAGLRRRAGVGCQVCQGGWGGEGGAQEFSEWIGGGARMAHQAATACRCEVLGVQFRCTVCRGKTKEGEQGNWIGRGRVCGPAARTLDPCVHAHS